MATHLHNLFGATFFGLPVRQYWADLALWEHFLAQEEHQDIRTIIELGTFKCGMSIFLSGQCISRGMNFWTFDKNKPEEMSSPIAQRMVLSLRFVHGDYFFGEANLALIQKLNEDKLHPLLLFIDGGSKPREFNTFVPRLRSGDYVVAHDYGTEYQAEDLEPTVNSLEPLFVEECGLIRPCLTRFWRVK